MTGQAQHHIGPGLALVPSSPRLSGVLQRKIWRNRPTAQVSNKGPNLARTCQPKLHALCGARPGWGGMGEETRGEGRNPPDDQPMPNSIIDRDRFCCWLLACFACLLARLPLLLGFSACIGHPRLLRASHSHASCCFFPVTLCPGRPWSPVEQALDVVGCGRKARG